ncbi:hypothetical protein F0562_014791 [Nyssa sinensis]|uniref:Uncharacterized protein n=1 Tax=Nyssa sinensis TaxID=561372 RepID=A0A5J4ZPD9_9ASTE|nr:hypothetical protein F0562_014791 [Nyssa sinensis]
MFTMGAVHLFLLSLSLLAIATAAHNITEILLPFPEYSLFNSYLTQTKLDDEINSRQTITVLALDNAAMSALAAKHPLSVIKNELSLHVLLDYYDSQKLHQISKGTTLTTTLYQTTGDAAGNLGFVNITDLRGGKVGFGSAAPGSALNSTYNKSVKQVPYNISVLEISQPIIAPGLLTAAAPSASNVNITALLEKAGCKIFASLIMSTGVLKEYQSAIDKGLTLFAPSDEAFKAPGIPDLSKLTNAEVVSLLQYHALASYTPIGTLKTTKDPVSTLATNGAGKFDLTVTTAGDSVTLHSGVVSSRIAGTVIDSTPLCIFTVDNVLLPTELFGKSPSPAPAPEPVTSPSPSPSPAPAATAPSPAPKAAKAPSPVYSPPAPPMSSPEGSPAEGPGAESENSTSENAAGDVKASSVHKMAVTLHTNLGDIKCEISCDEAPKTAENFLALCASGYYDGTIFHRNIKGFMIQGGDPTGTGKGGTSIWGKKFNDEIRESLKHNARGILSMANSGPNTNGSQFFISYAKQPHLNGLYTVFGKVIHGFEVLDIMEKTQTGPGDRPLAEIRMNRVTIHANPLAG